MVKEYKEINTRTKFSFEEEAPATEVKQVVEVDLDDVVPETQEGIAETPKVVVQTEEDEKVKARKTSRAQERIMKLANEKNELTYKLEMAEQREAELLKKLQVGDKGTKETLKSTLEQQVKTLQQQLISAIKNGEAEETVAIQSDLFQAQTKLEKLQTQVATESPIEQPIAKPAPAKQEVSEKAYEWVETHPEFKTDELFRGTAMFYNNQLISEGFNPNADEFYEELNERMAKRYPEVFGIEQKKGVNFNENADSSQEVKIDVKTEPLRSRNTEQVVSGPSRSAPAKAVQSRKVEVNLTEADLIQADRWNLSPKQMARRIAHSQKNKRSDGYVNIMIEKE